GDRVMDVRFEGQGQPEVDVRQKHLRLRGVPQCARRLAGDFLADRTAPAVIGLADRARPTPPVAQRGTRRAPWYLTVTATRIREPRHLYGLGLGLPCRNSLSSCQGNQVPSSGRQAESFERFAGLFHSTTFGQRGKVETHHRDGSLTVHFQLSSTVEV